MLLFFDLILLNIKFLTRKINNIKASTASQGVEIRNGYPFPL